eukprot:COSAG01_NODE_7_length_54400_cov_1218.054935_6_plen_319_part_00
MMMTDKKIEQVIIIGSGPAAHTAAIYTGRALLKPLLFEGEMAAGVAAGGQLTTTTDVENFPGFPKGIMGPELMMNMREQSINCDARILTKTVDTVDLSQAPFSVTVGADTYFAKTLIISTGATAKRMHLPGEETYWQKGISACAVCDGALPMFRNKPLVVIGGGDSACEEAHFLSKYASKVYLLVRRGEMRASKVMQERVKANDKIEIMWHTVATKVTGGDLLEAVHVQHIESKQEQALSASGLFYAIGHEPNTAFLEGQLETDETGYLLTQPDMMATSVPGVYACGDVQDKKYRQAITAAGTGCMAALEAEHFLQGV